MKVKFDLKIRAFLVVLKSVLYSRLVSGFGSGNYNIELGNWNYDTGK